MKKMIKFFTFLDLDKALTTDYLLVFNSSPSIVLKLVSHVSIAGLSLVKVVNGKV
jgi:hypothetical protein